MQAERRRGRGVYPADERADGGDQRGVTRGGAEDHAHDRCAVAPIDGAGDTFALCTDVAGGDQRLLRRGEFQPFGRDQRVGGPVVEVERPAQLWVRAEGIRQRIAPAEREQRIALRRHCVIPPAMTHCCRALQMSS